MTDLISNDKSIDLLMQSKQLIHTSYEVTAIQNRIFYYCLLSAQKEKNGELSCEIKLEDIRKLIPNKNQRTLANIKKMIQILKQTSLEFEKNEDGDVIECDYNLVYGSEFNVNKEIFKIKLAERLYNHLIDYTVYAPLSLDILTKFKSFYSQRLYELLRLWSRTDKIIVKNFKVDQIRFILGVTDKYPEYKNFKQRVLAQAIKEINQSGNMDVKIKEIKNGRKVEEIEFTILDHEKKIYFKNKVNTDIQTIEKDNSNVEEVQKDFYVPNKKLFTSKTLQSFISDFSSYDFSISEYKRILQDSILITLEKDNSDKVKAKSYNYFKTVLNNKLSESTSKPSKIKTKQHNVNSTFDKYKEDELEKVLAERQRDKFNDDRIFVPSFPNPNK